MRMLLWWWTKVKTTDSKRRAVYSRDEISNCENVDFLPIQHAYSCSEALSPLSASS